MSEITLRNVTKSYGSHVAIPGLDLDIPKGAFVTLLGPSGCGKTTTLRLIAGLEQATKGEVVLGTENGLLQRRRDFRSAGAARPRLHLPELCPVAEHEGRPQHHPGAVRGEASGFRHSREACRSPRQGPADRPGGPLPLRAVGRTAAARGGRPADRRAQHDPVDGRAPFEPRRQAQDGDAGRAQAPASRPRGDDGLRDPRPGRGADHVRHHRRDEERRDPAAGHAA